VKPLCVRRFVASCDVAIPVSISKGTMVGIATSDGETFERCSATRPSPRKKYERVFVSRTYTQRRGLNKQARKKPRRLLALLMCRL
jgi:hypothetical protein